MISTLPSLRLRAFTVTLLGFESRYRRCEPVGERPRLFAHKERMRRVARGLGDFVELDLRRREDLARVEETRNHLRDSFQSWFDALQRVEDQRGIRGRRRAIARLAYGQ